MFDKKTGIIYTTKIDTILNLEICGNNSNKNQLRWIFFWKLPSIGEIVSRNANIPLNKISHAILSLARNKRKITRFHNVNFCNAYRCFLSFPRCFQKHEIYIFFELYFSPDSVKMFFFHFITFLWPHNDKTTFVISSFDKCVFTTITTAPFTDRNNWLQNLKLFQIIKSWLHCGY